MLLISDPEVRQVLKMRDCIAAMERALAEEARGIAVNRPRTRYKDPPDLDKPGYAVDLVYDKHFGAIPEMFLCPGDLAHSPRRPENTWGLAIERKRRSEIILYQYGL